MFETNNTPFSMPVVPMNMGGGAGTGFGGWGNDWIALIIFAMIFGWGGFGNGFGGFGGGTGGVMESYTLNSDFATIQRQLSDGFNSIDNALDRQNAGICDLGYTALNLNNGTNMAIMQGNNALATQLADCCCKTQSGIERINTANAMNTAAIQNQIQQCCCDTEKQTMQTRYEMATQNCNTLQAIDKLGDRIIDYMAAEKAQALRDENQALRLAASQQAQNNYLVNQLRPCPTPAYVVQNPYCNCNGGYPYGLFGGTTIA